MKKILYVCAAVCAVFMMSSCKSKESAYKKAYEKAKAQQTETPVTTTTPVQQVTTQTVTPVTTTPVADYSNVVVRNESVTFVEGSPLKQYGVVVASVTIKSNGVALMQKLASSGSGERSDLLSCCRLQLRHKARSRTEARPTRGTVSRCLAAL